MMLRTEPKNYGLRPTGVLMWLSLAARVWTVCLLIAVFTISWRFWSEVSDARDAGGAKVLPTQPRPPQPPQPPQAKPPIPVMIIWIVGLSIASFVWSAMVSWSGHSQRFIWYLLTLAGESFLVVPWLLSAIIVHMPLKDKKCSTFGKADFQVKFALGFLPFGTFVVPGGGSSACDRTAVLYVLMYLVALGYLVGAMAVFWLWLDRNPAQNPTQGQYQQQGYGPQQFIDNSTGGGRPQQLQQPQQPYFQGEKNMVDGYGYQDAGTAGAVPARTAGAVRAAGTDAAGTDEASAVATGNGTRTAGAARAKTGAASRAAATATVPNGRRTLRLQQRQYQQQQRRRRRRRQYQHEVGSHQGQRQQDKQIVGSHQRQQVVGLCQRHQQPVGLMEQAAGITNQRITNQRTMSQRITNQQVTEVAGMDHHRRNRQAIPQLAAAAGGAAVGGLAGAAVVGWQQDDGPPNGPPNQFGPGAQQPQGPLVGGRRRLITQAELDAERPPDDLELDPELDPELFPAALNTGQARGAGRNLTGGPNDAGMQPGDPRSIHPDDQEPIDGLGDEEMMGDEQNYDEWEDDEGEKGLEGENGEEGEEGEDGEKRPKREGDDDKSEYEDDAFESGAEDAVDAKGRRDSTLKVPGSSVPQKTYKAYTPTPGLTDRGASTPMNGAANDKYKSYYGIGDYYDQSPGQMPEDDRLRTNTGDRSPYSPGSHYSSVPVTPLPLNTSKSPGLSGGKNTTARQPNNDDLEKNSGQQKSGGWFGGFFGGGK
ncbi:hypothetical protein B0T26DRAFT_746599 [Lasiosphaeria miniovina]|uniref:Uncharacterized protein n=1 Tax=Lasiosphaeria miniovina TaxID=1954250 RepID=A0AA40BIA1_9PEZI|nr:uncharacterized protein B0T26DRAFT_746599 [Lasiosphaeria miniovina]KAK0734727.1 hypothetical protein B0T26DRAFT_746599 [Lasiosphaeria miniovina]